jgi:Domain of unknown function (DUF5666)
MTGTESVTTPELTGEPTNKIAVTPAFALDPNSEPDEWPARGQAKGFRVNWLSALLLFLLVAGGGIWGGAELQKHQGSGSTSSALSALESRFAGRGGTGSTGRTGTGTSRFGGAGTSSAAVGTVTEIKGSTLYITNASGNLVEVTLTSSTTVTRDAKTTASALVPGDTVVVQGSTAKNGTVTASSVAATAQGVTGGLGGLFGGTGG